MEGLGFKGFGGAGSGFKAFRVEGLGFRSTESRFMVSGGWGFEIHEIGAWIWDE